MNRLGDRLGGASMGFSVRYGRGVEIGVLDESEDPRIYAGEGAKEDGSLERDSDTPRREGGGRARRGGIGAPMSAVRVSVLADNFLRRR